MGHRHCSQSTGKDTEKIIWIMLQTYYYAKGIEIKCCGAFCFVFPARPLACEIVGAESKVLPVYFFMDMFGWSLEKLNQPMFVCLFGGF